MFLSFIVPVYNTEKYLCECLDSLLDQDIPHDEYELVCINDGSTDESLSILREYEARYPNVVVIEQNNSGVAVARNTGMAVANGEYIWFVDSDDLVHSNVLSRLRQVASERLVDRIRVGTYVFMEELTTDEKNNIDQNNLKANSEFYDSVVWNCLLRKDFLYNNECYFHYPQVTHGEDTLFMYELVSHDPTQIVVAIPAYLYRTHLCSAQTDRSRTNQSRKLQSYLHAALVMQQHWNNRDGLERDTANYLMTFLWNALNTSFSVSEKERKKALKQLKDADLYPYQRPQACTLKKSYQTTRTDFVGKIFDQIYIHLHRPWGYWSMWCIQKAIGLKHRLLR